MGARSGVPRRVLKRRAGVNKKGESRRAASPPVETFGRMRGGRWRGTGDFFKGPLLSSPGSFFLNFPLLRVADTQGVVPHHFADAFEVLLRVDAEGPLVGGDHADLFAVFENAHHVDGFDDFQRALVHRVEFEQIVAAEGDDADLFVCIWLGVMDLFITQSTT